jgi:hypothetical protein
MFIVHIMILMHVMEHHYYTNINVYMEFSKATKMNVVYKFVLIRVVLYYVFQKMLYCLYHKILEPLVEHPL